MALARVDVLIVDDDEVIRTMLRRALQRLGLVCAEARDGIDALECLSSIDCAVILLDLMMPRLDGYGFIEQFTESAKYHQRPVIFAISASGEEQLRRVKADSIHAIIRKPFELPVLAEIVALCVSTRWAASAKVL